MQIQKDHVVVIEYQLYAQYGDEERELIEETTSKNPLHFVFGAGLMLDAFEKALEGKKKGDHFEIAIPCEEAYQKYDKNAVLKLDSKMFVDENGEFASDMVYPGAIVQLEDEEGEIFPAVVNHLINEKDLENGQVEVDINHPLVDHDLFFIGKIQDIRPATAIELENPSALMGNVFEHDA